MLWTTIGSAPCAATDPCARTGLPKLTAQCVFVDETKRTNYLLVATFVQRGDLEAVRRTLRDLVLPGQKRLHMKSERDQRKRMIASAVVGSHVRAIVYDADRRYGSELDRRAACLRALVHDVALLSGVDLVFDRDETLVSWDNQRLIEFTREANSRGRLRYRHETAAAELLLALPDAVAWCWAKGGDWRRRVESVVTDVRQV